MASLTFAITPSARGNCDRTFAMGKYLPKFWFVNYFFPSVKTIFAVQYWFTTDPYAVPFKRVRPNVIKSTLVAMETAAVRYKLSHKHMNKC